MAKTSMTERDKKRAYLIKKYAKKRAKIKNIINNPNSTIVERIEAGRMSVSYTHLRAHET